MENTQQIDSISHHRVCVSNLSVRRIEFLSKNLIEQRSSSQYDTVLLVTKGIIRISVVKDDIFTDFAAPHTVILEKGRDYTFESVDDFVEIFDIGALRHNTGDIVNPENLVRSDYPFDPTRSYEEQQI